MRIHCTGRSKRLKSDWMDEPIEFNSNGTAQVPDDVGDRLVEELDAIEPYDADGALSLQEVIDRVTDPM